MEAKYLKHPDLGVTESGWYAVQGNKIYGGPWSEAEAKAWVAAWLRDHTPSSSTPDDDDGPEPDDDGNGQN